MPPRGERVVVDPEELRRVGLEMRRAAAMLSAAGRSLATRPLPIMPSGVETGLSDAIRHANGELQDLASELLQEAAQLFERATRAELGGTSSVAWLLPSLSRLPNPVLGSSLSAGASTWGGVGGDELSQSARWAPRLLEEMFGAAGSFGEETVDPLDRLDDERRAQLLGSVFGDEARGEDLGVVAMTAGAGLDVYEQEATSEGRAAGLVEGTLQGALAVHVPEGASGAPLAGLIGCLRTGSMGDSPKGT